MERKKEKTEKKGGRERKGRKGGRERERDQRRVEREGERDGGQREKQGDSKRETKRGRNRDRERQRHHRVPGNKRPLQRENQMLSMSCRGRARTTFSKETVEARWECGAHCPVSAESPSGALLLCASFFHSEHI